MIFTSAETMHERICQWLRENHQAHSSDEHELVVVNSCLANVTTLSYLSNPFDVGDNFAYTGHEIVSAEIASPVTVYFDGRPGSRSGAVRFDFTGEDATFDVLMLAAWVYDADMHSSIIALASVPKEYIAQWLAFEKECVRICHSAIPYRGKVYIVGGMETSFDATVQWDDIYLPEQLKDDIMRDIDAFFTKGVQIYQRLKIKPFRKLLFAGVPGTGKTMLCSAIAGWGQQNNYFVVYVSGSNQFGAKFWKIHEALEMAASSEAPTIVIVEELDSYLDEENKAQMLNVLDGSESPTNNYGTILISTTNHPEKIDDRVMKRPGRLDRIFIIPEMQSEETAQQMLQEYLGHTWREEHKAIVPELIGRPGAFIREVALYALTMAAYDEDAENVSLETLRKSMEMLTQQIEAKDDFLTAHKKGEMGLGAAAKRAKKNGFLRIEE